MRRIVVSEFVSIDGVFEDPGGSEGTAFGGWQIPLMGEDAGMYKFNELKESDALLLGKRTYEGFAAAWPKLEKETGEFGKLMNSLPKYVVSDDADKPELTWNNSHLIFGDVAGEIRKLKEQDGKDILVGGSGTLVRFLLEYDLADEYRLMVHPIVLGEGRNLFGSASTKILELKEVTQLSKSIVILTYQPAHK